MWGVLSWFWCNSLLDNSVWDIWLDIIFIICQWNILLPLKLVSHSSIHFNPLLAYLLHSLHSTPFHTPLHSTPFHTPLHFTLHFPLSTLHPPLHTPHSIPHSTPHSTPLHSTLHSTLHSIPFHSILINFTPHYLLLTPLTSLSWTEDVHIILTFVVC